MFELPDKLERIADHYAGECSAGSADVYSHLTTALAYHWHGKYAEALEVFNRAASAERSVPYVLCARASLLSTCPLAAIRNGKKALADAQRAYEAARLDGELRSEWLRRTYVAVLAAALAECGEHEQAAAVLSQAHAYLCTSAAKIELGGYLKIVSGRKPIRAVHGLVRRSLRRQFANSLCSGAFAVGRRGSKTDHGKD